MWGEYNSHSEIRITVDFLVERPWSDILSRDKYFISRIIKRYHELRKTYLCDKSIRKETDDIRNYPGMAAERSFQVWEYIKRRKNGKAVQHEMKEPVPTQYLVQVQYYSTTSSLTATFFTLRETRYANTKKLKLTAPIGTNTDNAVNSRTTLDIPINLNS